MARLLATQVGQVLWTVDDLPSRAGPRLTDGFFTAHSATPMIVVTGGMGFLGLHVARALLDVGEDVVLTSHRTARQPEFLEPEWGVRVHVAPLDLRDAAAVAHLLKRPGVSGVVHLAVPPRFGISPSDEMRLACEMFTTVLGTAIELHIPRVVMASSIAVYFGNDSTVWHEEDRISLEAHHPITAIKRSEEAIASFLGHTSDSDVVRARITAVWGPLYNTMLNAPARLALLAAGRADRLGDLPDPRNAHPDDELELMHVRDCARVLAYLQNAPDLSHDVYNVGGNLVRYGDLVDAANATGPQDPIELRPPDREPVSSARLDITRLRATGYSPTVSVKAGVSEYVDWLRTHDA